MNKIYKLIISILFGCCVFSNIILTAGRPERETLVVAINNLFFDNTLATGPQQSVVEFLSDLHIKNPIAFKELFNYIANKKNITNVDLTRALSDKQVNEKTTEVFNFISQILNDYNSQTKKQNKESFMGCGGCFTSWCQENGTRMLRFSITNVASIVNYIANSNRTAHQPNIDIILNKLSGQMID